MNEKIVTSQAELDAIPVDYNGKIIIKFGTANSLAVVSKKYLRPVEASDDSFVWASGNSSVEAYGDSSVCAYGDSFVCAYDNSQVDAQRRGNIKGSGNARIVYNPDNITDWALANGITITDGKIRLYKAVHKRDDKYVADWDSNFIYTIGAVAEAKSCRCTKPVKSAPRKRWSSARCHWKRRALWARF